MKWLLFILAFSTTTACAQSQQEKKYLISLLGFYNLENLFDTIDGPNRDEEFLPGGTKNYTAAVYLDKLDNLARVISEIGIDRSPDGLAVLGCAEVENESVLKDLTSHSRLAGRHYKYVHYDSPDERGIDVGLIYNPRYFKPVSSKPLYVDNRNPDGTPRYTRDVLYVYGLLSGEPIHLMVVHWPSRRGGEQASAPYREQAASVCRGVIDSVMRLDPDAKVILMGDLNDDPVNKSVVEVIGGSPDRETALSGGMYNPWMEYYREGHGTLAYRDAWNLFDQILFSGAWLSEDGDGFFFHEAVIFKKHWLLQKKGKYRGYPFRTYNFNKYMGGYSDHFPTYVVLLKTLHE